MNDRERTKQNRMFLHDLASPLSILDIVMNQLVNLRSAPLTEENAAKQDRLLGQARKSLDKMKSLHADFRDLQSTREREDKCPNGKKAC